MNDVYHSVNIMLMQDFVLSAVLPIHLKLVHQITHLCCPLLCKMGGCTSLLKVPDLVVFWLNEIYLEIMKEWLGNSQSFKDFTKKQISLSSSNIDIDGRRLSVINLDL